MASGEAAVAAEKDEIYQRRWEWDKQWLEECQQLLEKSASIGKKSGTIKEESGTIKEK